jgi:hypothetical protein
VDGVPPAPADCKVACPWCCTLTTTRAITQRVQQLRFDPKRSLVLAAIGACSPQPTCCPICSWETLDQEQLAVHMMFCEGLARCGTCRLTYKITDAGHHAENECISYRCYKDGCRRAPHGLMSMKQRKEHDATHALEATIAKGLEHARLSTLLLLERSMLLNEDDDDIPSPTSPYSPSSV